MRHIFLLMAIFLSVHLSAQHVYDEQRQKEVNNYLESIRKGREYGNIKTSEFKMNEQAVQEMVDRWKGKPSVEIADKTRLELERLERIKQRKIQEMVANKAYDEQRIETSIMHAYITDLYVANGILPFEAEKIAGRRIGQKLQESGLQHDLFYVTDPEVDLAIKAYNEYQDIKDSGSFDELSQLIYDFRILGYSATLAIERLEKRFPDKKQLISSAKPYFGISFFNQGHVYSTYHVGSEKTTYNEIYVYMLERFKEWYANSPVEFFNVVFNDRDFNFINDRPFELIWDATPLEKRPQILRDWVVASAQATSLDDTKFYFLQLVIHKFIEDQTASIPNKRQKQEAAMRLAIRKEFHKLFTYEDYINYREGYKLIGHEKYLMDEKSLINRLYLDGVTLRDKNGNKHRISIKGNK